MTYEQRNETRERTIARLRALQRFVAKHGGIAGRKIGESSDGRTAMIEVKRFDELLDDVLALVAPPTPTRARPGREPIETVMNRLRAIRAEMDDAPDEVAEVAF